MLVPDQRTFTLRKHLHLLLLLEVVTATEQQMIKNIDLHDPLIMESSFSEAVCFYILEHFFYSLILYF